MEAKPTKANALSIENVQHGWKTQKVEIGRKTATGKQR